MQIFIGVKWNISRDCPFNYTFCRIAFPLVWSIVSWPKTMTFCETVPFIVPSTWRLGAVPYALSKCRPCHGTFHLVGLSHYSLALCSLRLYPIVMSAVQMESRSLSLYSMRICMISCIASLTIHLLCRGTVPLTILTFALCPLRLRLILMLSWSIDMMLASSATCCRVLS